MTLDRCTRSVYHIAEDGALVMKSLCVDLGSIVGKGEMKSDHGLCDKEERGRLCPMIVYLKRVN